MHTLVLELKTSAFILFDLTIMYVLVTPSLSRQHHKWSIINATHGDPFKVGLLKNHTHHNGVVAWATTLHSLAFYPFNVFIPTSHALVLFLSVTHADNYIYIKPGKWLRFILSTKNLTYFLFSALNYKPDSLEICWFQFDARASYSLYLWIFTIKLI